MSESCRESCPLVLLAQCQKHLAKDVGQLLVAPYFETMDRISRAEAESEYPIVSLERAKEIVEELGPRIAELADIADRANSLMDEALDTAVKQCPGLKIEQLGQASVIYCGGFFKKSIEELAPNQSALMAALKSDNSSA